MAIWSLLRPFGIFYGHCGNLVHFPSVGKLYHDKSGNPASRRFAKLFVRSAPRKEGEENKTGAFLQSVHHFEQSGTDHPLAFTVDADKNGDRDAQRSIYSHILLHWPGPRALFPGTFFLPFYSDTTSKDSLMSIIANKPDIH
jgi:hypothetical protein